MKERKVDSSSLIEMPHASPSRPQPQTPHGGHGSYYFAAVAGVEEVRVEEGTDSNSVSGRNNEVTSVPAAPTRTTITRPPGLQGGAGTLETLISAQAQAHFKVTPHRSSSSSSSPSTTTPPAPNLLPLQPHVINPTHASSPSTTPPSKHSILHAHRQNHNSSKLPAYRFADLNKESIALSSLLQHQQQQIPPSPVSPDSDRHHDTYPNTVNQFSPPIAHSHPPTPETTTQIQSIQSIQSPSQNHSSRVSPDPHTPLEKLHPVGSRASASVSASPSPTHTQTSATTSSPHVKPSTSLYSPKTSPPNTPGVTSPSESTDTVATVVPRRASVSLHTPSRKDSDTETARGGGGLPAAATTQENISGQRELLLPKVLQRAATSDDKRASSSKRPPLSYKPRTNSSGSVVSASIPPIRSFRSSGERRSLVLDMNVRSMRSFDGGDDYSDPNHRDRTLRALEGRRADEAMQWTPPGSAGERPDADDSGDLFLKIAREESSQKQRTADNGRVYADNPSAISRVARSARRPLSVAISSSYRSPSPPRVSRRLSEQESAWPRGSTHEQGERGEKTAPPVSYRGHAREPQSDDYKHRGISSPIRGSPLTPRTLTYQDVNSEPSSATTRRRQPSIDRASAALSRMASLKQANVNYSHPRSYNSSPLVAHTADPPKQDALLNEATHAEGTESTTSTAAPSTVWDELEELKSRIHRLELTGKLPATSSAAILRASDERPQTAHTNATTLSASPKRGASSVVQSTEPAAHPKDTHPLLHSALAKAKDFLAPQVYDALEAATADALGLASIMGTAGQPGPISSGASNIGSSTGTVTDRQLRKKADGVCRSLTELCLALSEGVPAIKPQQITAPPREDDDEAGSPTITQFPGLAQRRPSVPANRAVEFAVSPRAASRYDEKRVSILTPSALPSPRYSSNLCNTKTDVAAEAAGGRKTSLLLSRARRAGTEEPEDGRKTSAVLRSRRAGTEEPEDRKPILTRGRRATLDESEDESRFRTPSRAITEVNGFRPREYISHLPPPPVLREGDTLANSALPRRRVGSTTFNTRLAQPAPITTTTTTTTPTASAIATPSRQYFHRSVPARETGNEADRVAEDRTQQRQFSLARSGSLNRRTTNRQSMIATPSTTNLGYYR